MVSIAQCNESLLPQLSMRKNLRLSFNPLTTDLPLAYGMGPSPEERASCSDCLCVISLNIL
jgi:hypothetical protein